MNCHFIFEQRNKNLLLIKADKRKLRRPLMSTFRLLLALMSLNEEESTLIYFTILKFFSCIELFFHNIALLVMN